MDVAAFRAVGSMSFAATDSHSSRLAKPRRTLRNSPPEIPLPSDQPASFPGYALREDLPGYQATAAPGENAGARCGSRRPSGAGGSGAGHAVAVARPVMPPGAWPS
jgi:hypothetical protein